MTGASINFAGRGATHEKGGGPEGRPQEKIDMTKVMERPTKGKIDPTPYLLVSNDRKAAIWLDEQVAKSQATITTQVADLTPELARILLGRNPGNRTISEHTVTAYTRDMTNGAWRMNGEPIIIAKDGSLNDGQHRCMAVILSNKSIPVVLIVGVDRDTRTTLDQGRIRTAGDYLSMEGHTDTLSLAAAARLIWQWQKFSLVSGSPQYKPTKGELMALVERTPALVKSLHAISWNNIAPAGSRAMLAFCHFAFGLTAPKGEVETFMTGLSSGENLSGDSPVLYCRNRLLAEKSRLKVGERAELIFRAWNACRRGETPKSIALQGGELPMVE